MGPEDLRTALAGLPCFTDPNLLYGLNPGDDTGVYRLREDLAIVQTVDFFTPIVDNPYEFGQIAAANALSDCYTMGAKPVTGLNLVSYPCAVGLDTLGEILRGGAEKMIEAGAVIVGGHSIDDPEPKYGIAVTGIVDPRAMITNTQARPGDSLVLTKKIGTGIVTTLNKPPDGFAGWMRRFHLGGDGHTSIPKEVYEEAVRSMRTLNQRAGEIMVEFGAHACTDVTGYGLLGHAHNVAEASGVGMEISFEKVPRFEGIEAFAIPGTRGGGERNRKWMREKVTLSPGATERELAVLCDAQTSGPLLIALPPEKAGPMVEKMKREGVPAPAIIGQVTDGPAGHITIL